MIPGQITDALDALDLRVDDETALSMLVLIRFYIIEQDARLERFLEAAKQAEEVAG